MLTTLQKLEYIIKDAGVPEGAIVIWRDDDGTYGIDVDGEIWSNFLSEEDALCELRCLTKGFILGKDLRK